ncbi:cell envelope-related function transcriptional attenuator common domain-containing protein [Raineyella antarctica]|uniref:Cell envelope-related function transcriptional attenuator common domain-containing protein n=1 Tax=Raineyella antarctica TaxID=1577474 RepID=A0A1G6H6K8_9ACTN|nr:LCP family protein [Raineyella antarctica]SDB89086.1 cell envelope-related function transcriptional attenuator common domain-containing protein [Raineyella antarctica]
MAGRDDDLDWLYGRGEDHAPDSRPFGEEPAPSSAPPPPPDPYEHPAPRPEPYGRAEGPSDPYGRSQRPDRYGRAELPPDPHVRPVPAPRASPPQGERPPDAPPPPPPSAMRRPPRPAGKPRDARPRKHPRTRRQLQVVIAVLLVYLLAFPAWAWFGSGRVDATSAGNRPHLQAGITLLMTGSDSRAGMTDAQKRALGTGSAAGERSDTIMLLHVPVLGAPTLLSIPRDSYVSVPGHGKNKINAAYSIGGPALLAQTIEENTGVRIDGYVSLGFDGFVSVIDALGGIRMCLPAPMKDAKAHIDLPAGCQVLTGANALGYVRMRYSDPRGDIGRAERQRQMVAATAKKALSPLTLINPVRWISLNNAIRGAVSRGQDTGPLDALALVYGAGFIGMGGGHTFAVPVSNPDYKTSVGEAVLWDQAKAKEVFHAFATGNTIGLGRFDAGN